jgi:hypothetical protein
MKRGNVQSRKCPARIVYERLVADENSKLIGHSERKWQQRTFGENGEKKNHIVVFSW